MRVKLTLRRQSGVPVDVVITADATATVADVAHAIAANDPTVAAMPPAGTRLTLAVGAPTVDRLERLEPEELFGESAIGSGFNAAVVAYTGRTGRGPEHADAAAVLRIHNGPEGGRQIELRRGNSVIGRGAGADVLLADPLVSKRHARVEVGASIELVDLNSANGVIVDGGLVQRVRVIPGQVYTLGDTEISIVPVQTHEAEDDPVLERGGALMFNRSPRVEVRYPGTKHPHPAVPKETTPRMFPWPMVVAPVLLGVTMFIVTERPMSLMIAFMSPLMMLGNYYSSHTQQGKKLKQEVETFEEQVEELEIALEQQKGVERERRHAEAPAVAHVYEQAMRLGPLLWTRRPEHWNFLALRLGVGRAKSRNTIEELSAKDGIVRYQRQVQRLRDRYEYAEDVPIVELLPSSGALGIAGPMPVAADVMRGIGVQLFGLHAPNEIITAAIVDPAWSRELEWLKWLPHTSSSRNPFADFALADSQSAGTALLNALEEAILERLSGSPSRRGPLKDADTSMALGAQVGDATDRVGVSAEGDSALVLIVSADAPVDRPRLIQLIERGADVGIYTIFLGPSVESLPAACRTFVDASAGLEQARVGYVRAGETFEQVRVEGVSQQYAEVFAKRLAPVVDASTVDEDSSDLPRTVSMLGLIGHELAEQPGSVVERWRQNNSVIDRSGHPLPRMKRAGTLKAYIGQASPDAMTLDLRTQGPHALVGGTTGAGKSEFLQAWVLGMAAEYSPDRVTFLFVDYKGGSAFADCVELPHCVGLVTDLSPHLVRRALTSLRAELHYREHLFNRKKAKDLLELEKRRDPETPPALVLVIDEFAALAGEVPEFVDGVVDIAQRGRSLGIHLIMATQRPAGVIKDNLRANTNLRVALRMADESDSKDVVGDPVAGTFDPSIPGRGIAKTGPGRLVPFQSAYAGGWSTNEAAKAEVRVAELRFGSLVLWERDAEPESDSHDGDPGPNDQKRMVRSFIRAAVDARIPAPRRPWLDDLAATVALEALPSEGDSRILLGLADIPERQLQEAMTFEPDRDGAMLVYGTSGSGKSTVLRTIAASVGMRPDLGTAEVYGLDFGSGALRSLEALPHVGSIIPGDDAERIQRLLRTLGEVLDRRGRSFSEVNASSLTEYRRITGVAEPRIVLLLDGFGQFKSDWDSTTVRMPFYQLFMRLLGEGRPLGVHVVATADRAGAVPTAVSANITKRVVLRMSEESAYQVLGVAKDVLGDDSAPGRAIVEGFETQIAVMGGTTNVAEQTKELERLAERLRAAGAHAAPEIGALPVSFPEALLPASIGGEAVLGLSDTTLAPFAIETVGTFVVTGPPQSGKTNALRSIVNSMLRLDPEVKLFHFGGRRSQLTGFAPWVRSATTVDAAKALAKELVEIIPDESIQGRLMIVVEGVTQFADSEAERAMKEMFQAINRSDHFLIGDADVSALSSGFGFIGDFKSARQGVALKPDAYDGDSVFKTAFPKVKRAEFPEGRGIFVQNGRITTVQLPLVEGETAVVPGGENSPFPGGGALATVGGLSASTEGGAR
ncbi:FtsK/SpoIIIE domain-containing protein [Agromyces archimandritae]|uniref:FHA domain-containing protein n=1 Tax=Agromyces archimandritae TaxID=2781962 RepID=A0A975FQS7_9MICO|nr:FtsK/SpoIIIE domain-containing protein [Agromyces archimandritae]QTX05506.1 FHA domain-containing protein [Agromyces archimandritae]